jgi:hypothetical protein
MVQEGPDRPGRDEAGRDEAGVLAGAGLVSVGIDPPDQIIELSQFCMK